MLQSIFNNNFHSGMYYYISTRRISSKSKRCTGKMRKVMIGILLVFSPCIYSQTDWNVVNPIPRFYDKFVDVYFFDETSGLLLAKEVNGLEFKNKIYKTNNGGVNWEITHST